MMNRRTAFTAAASTAAFAATLGKQVAEAKTNPVLSANIEPRGADGRLERLATLDLESQQDFTLGFRLMQSKQIRKASDAMFMRVLETKGIDPTQQISVDELRALLEADPAVNLAQKTWLANQQITWKTLRDHYHANADAYLGEMEAADNTGPGKLELNPNMDIPQYARHEIHIQPGGYVGDPFAGHIYHYGTNSFYISVIGHNEQDQIHKATAGRLPLPADGKVRRILDMGCGVGQMTLALQERFPDAEVWGIDVGGPMVRYAHMRANRLGLGANFAQRLAENTGFPDGYFDLVTSYIVHHELPAETTRQVVAEANRITRTGGVYYPLDFNTGGLKGSPRGMYARWWDHRWNNEVWSLEYHGINFSDEIAKRGFDMPKNPVAALPGFGARHAIKV